MFTALIIASLAIGAAVFLAYRRPRFPPPELQRVAAWFAYPEHFDMSREPLNPFFVHTTDGELTALQKDGLACIAIYVELWLRNADLFGVQGAFIREKLAIIGGQEAAFALLMETMIENGKARYENGRYFAATVTQ